MADSAAPASGSKAVFLSYTSDDKTVALAVCEALRDAGVEVWMDQSELQGGDAWDEHIRRQLRECALIIPIISARTQARREGYFRLEWKLADERMHLVAEGTPLIVPVVADDTQQKDALVPKSFLTVQWSRLPHGHVPPAFVARVRKLLGLEAASATPTVPPMGLATSHATASEIELLEPVDTGVAHAIGRSGKPAPSRASQKLVPLVAGCLLGAVLVGGVGSLFWPMAQPRPVNRWVYEIPLELELRPSANSRLIAMAPDGRSFVFNAAKGLYLRKLDELEARLIPGTEEFLTNPFFAPDAGAIGYTTSLGMKRISIGGGTPIDITPGVGHGLWLEDGNLLIGGRSNSGILSVPAAGGTPTALIKGDATETLSSPLMLPDGDLILFVVRSEGSLGEDSQLQVVAQSRKSGTRTVLVRGASNPLYLPTGHLLYVSGNTLFGVRFDARVPAVSGGAVALVKGIKRGDGGNLTYGSAQYAVSKDGTLLYIEGSEDDAVSSAFWVDREGHETPFSKAGLTSAQFPRLSPDGTRLAVVSAGDVWVHFADGKPPIKLTTGGSAYSPLWTPDGLNLVYELNGLHLNQIKADGSETTPQRASLEGHYHPHGWSADGRTFLAVRLGTNQTGTDIVQWPVADFKAVEPVLQTPAGEGLQGAILSPDGRWLAYASDQTGPGQQEIWVRPYPGPGAPQRVSFDGGKHPVWEKHGRELYFIGGAGNSRRLMAAKVMLGATFSFEPATPLFSLAPYIGLNALQPPSYDVADDGRFLLLKSSNPAAENKPKRIVVVENWFEEVKRALPVDRK
jgi:Tol biopolymer transport system component